jgi:hypothetical protein
MILSSFQVGSLSFSVMAGKVMFRDFCYVTPDWSVRSLDGYIIFRCTAFSKTGSLVCRIFSVVSTGSSLKFSSGWIWFRSRSKLLENKALEPFTSKEWNKFLTAVVQGESSGIRKKDSFIFVKVYHLDPDTGGKLNAYPDRKRGL